MLRSAFAKSPVPPPDARPSLLPVADPGAFDRVVLAADEDCLALFGTAWCRACWRASERLARLADRGSFAALAIDVEASPELARRYLVTGIPTILHFRNVAGCRTAHRRDERRRSGRLAGGQRATAAMSRAMGRTA
jgi:hypothetical protein